MGVCCIVTVPAGCFSLAGHANTNGDKSGNNVSQLNTSQPSAQALVLETVRVVYAPMAGFQANQQAALGGWWQSANRPPPSGVEVITVTGQRIGGGSVQIGFSCASVMCGAMQDSISNWLQDRLAEASQRFIEPEEVTDRVCDTIRANSPGYCAANYSSIARLRNFPNTWQFPATTNGCGSGGILEDLAFNVVRRDHNWNDDINEPILGRSFRSACNNHDICYNNQQDKASCDSVFRRAMESVCGGNADCLVASDFYHGAVRGNLATSAYIRAGQAATCSRIKQSYAANYCPAT